MTAAFLVVLALAWMAFVLPAAMRGRQAAPLSQAERFRRGLRLIAPARPSLSGSQGRWILIPDRDHDRVARGVLLRHQRRRRLIVVALVVGAAASGAFAAMVGGRAWAVNAFLDGVTAFYLAYLTRSKARRDRQRSQVRSLHSGRKSLSLYLPPPATGERKAAGG